MKKYISIIVPIYNSEKFLEKCLFSLVNQTLKNIEIILINDGSTDTSSYICKKYNEKYNEKIVYIERENKGRSATRNQGIKIAKGEYILFVDSDDYLELNACEELVNIIKKTKKDIILFDYKEEGNTFNNIVTLKRNPENKIEFLDYKNQVVYCWNKIFRKDFLVKNNLLFPEKISNSEDFYFSFKSILRAKSIEYIKKQFYNYIYHENNSIFKIENRYDTLKVFEKIYLESKESEYISFKKYFYKDFEYFAVKCYFLILSDKNYVTDEEYFKNKKIYLKKLNKLDFLTSKIKLKIYIYNFLSIILRKFNLYGIVKKLKNKRK